MCDSVAWRTGIKSFVQKPLNTLSKYAKIIIGLVVVVVAKLQKFGAINNFVLIVWTCPPAPPLMMVRPGLGAIHNHTILVR